VVGDVEEPDVQLDSLALGVGLECFRAHERVATFKRVSHAAVIAMADTIDNALPGLGPRGALDIVTAANAVAATLWQVAHPPEALARAYADDPTIAPTWALDFVPTLTRLLTATCLGLTAQTTNSQTKKRRAEAPPNADCPAGGRRRRW
jgi:hypothetical protein